MSPSSQRMLLVQTSPELDAELRVMETLLSADVLHEGEVPALTVMVVAGTRGTSVREAAEAFRRLAVVQRVLELDIGRLRIPREGPRQLTQKVIDRLAVARRLRNLTPAIRAFAPTVVYSPQDRLDVALASGLAKSLRIPQVIHLHYPCGPSLGSEVLGRLRETDRVVAVSEFIRRSAIEAGADPARTVVVRNTLRSTAVPAVTLGERAVIRGELGLSPESVLVLMAARLAPWKGQEDLVRAMLPVLHERANAHLMLVGDELPRGTNVVSRIRNLIEEDAAGQRVHLAGGRPRAEVVRLLQAADVFAHPSREEAFGLAVLEAMSAGLPVVVWDDGALPELVVDGTTGLVAPTGDIGALSRSLDRLVLDAELRRRLGQAGRNRVDADFNPDLVAPLLPTLLAEVAA